MVQYERYTIISKNIIVIKEKLLVQSNCSFYCNMGLYCYLQSYPSKSSLIAISFCYFLALKGNNNKFSFTFCHVTFKSMEEKQILLLHCKSERAIMKERTNLAITILEKGNKYIKSYFEFVDAILFSSTIVSKNIIATTKYEIIMVPSNHSFFQYCDSNNGVFFIAPCKVITLTPLCILFGISSLLLFLWFCFKVIALPTIAIAIVVALKGDSDKINITFR